MGSRGESRHLRHQPRQFNTPRLWMPCSVEDPLMEAPKARARRVCDRRTLYQREVSGALLIPQAGLDSCYGALGGDVSMLALA